MTSEIRYSTLEFKKGEVSVGDLLFPCQAYLWPSEHVMENDGLVMRYNGILSYFGVPNFQAPQPQPITTLSPNLAPWLSACWHWCTTLAEEHIQRLLVYRWFSPQNLRWPTVSHGQPLVCRNSRYFFLGNKKTDKQTNQVSATSRSSPQTIALRKGPKVWNAAAKSL